MFGRSKTDTLRTDTTATFDSDATDTFTLKNTDSSVRSGSRDGRDRNSAENQNEFLRGSSQLGSGSFSSSDKTKTNKFSTLQNLLDAAVGSPERPAGSVRCESGDVNFSYLHEVISEILRYLEKSKTAARRCSNGKLSQLPKRNTSDTNLPLIRRIEATESFIQELAKTVKKIYNEIDDAPKSESMQSLRQTHSQTKALNEAVSRLSAKLQTMDSKFSDFTTKESVSQHSITPEYVKSVIDESIQTCKCEIDSSMRERNDKIRSLQEIVMNDIQFFEDRMKKIAERNLDMEECLKKKADAAALEWKCDRSEIETLTQDFGTRNSSLHSEINQVKETVRVSAENLHGMKLKNEDFSRHQTTFGGIIRRFETEVEDTRHSIQYLKTSTSAHADAKNQTDDTLIKIRTTMNDVQEKQRLFQTQLDNLSNEYKRTDVRFANIADDVKILRETKADDANIMEALSSKADKKEVMHAVTVGNFDAFGEEVDERLKNMSQKMAGNETNVRKLLCEVVERFDETLKTKKEELKEIRDYIDHRVQNATNSKKNSKKHPPPRNNKPPSKSSKSSFSNNCIVCDTETKTAEVPWGAGGGWMKILFYLIFSHIISLFVVSKLGS